MNSGSRGLVFDIQRFSLHDGPGIRTTVFLKGCPLRCVWCHNPESQLPKPEILFDEKGCNFCRKCLEACESGAIKLENEKLLLLKENCNACGKCAELCPTNAIRICGTYMSVEEVTKEVLKDEIFYKFSDGGVTISGGEPLFQPNFLLNLLRDLSGHNLSICLDTSGYSEKYVFLRAVSYADIILYDIKTLDPEKHLKLTGVSLERILTNLNLALNSAKQIVVRIPVVYGVNFASIEELSSTVNELAEMGIKRFELIPYHRFGEEKYRMLGRELNLEVKPLNLEKLNVTVKEIVKITDVDVKVSRPILM